MKISELEKTIKEVSLLTGISVASYIEDIIDGLYEEARVYRNDMHEQDMYKEFIENK